MWIQTHGLKDPHRFCYHDASRAIAVQCPDAWSSQTAPWCSAGYSAQGPQCSELAAQAILLHWQQALCGLCSRWRSAEKLFQMQNWRTFWKYVTVLCVRIQARLARDRIAHEPVCSCCYTEVYGLRKRRGYKEPDPDKPKAPRPETVQEVCV